MELKPGYKQTEVGVIPEGWDVVKIGTISKITTGPFGTLLKASEYSVDDNGAPLVSVGEVRDGFIKITGHTPRVPPSVIRRLPQYILRSGDIVFGRKGAVDRSALITEEEDGYFLGSDGISVRLSGPCNPAYVSCQLRSHRIRDWLVQNATGTTMASLNQGILKKIPLALPPRPEQDAIAYSISELDDLIQGLDELIFKKCNIKQAAMQELLTGKRRLRGFGPTRSFKRYEYGLIPEDWNTELLLKVSSMSGRIGWQGLKQEEFTDNPDDPFLITGINFKEGKIDWSSVYHIPEKRYLEASPIQLKPRDILMTKAGTIGKLLFVETIPHPGKASLNSHLLVLRPVSNRYIPEFLYYQLASPYFASHIEANKSGSTFFGLTQAAAGRYPVVLPSIDEQMAIGSALFSIDDAIDQLQHRLKKMQLLKAGILQELLTGRTRLQ